MTESAVGSVNQHYRYHKEPTTITRVLKALLWIGIVVSIISLFFDYLQLDLLSRSFTEAQAESNDTRQMIVGLLATADHIVMIIVFWIWLYRTNDNCHGFGAEGMEFTPGWSVGYYFIPILNLYRPYQSMNELWKVSSNPMQWQQEHRSALVGWWWGLWILSWIMGQIVLRATTKAETVGELKAMTIAIGLSTLVDIMFFFVFLKLVSAIMIKQNALTRTRVDE